MGDYKGIIYIYRKQGKAFTDKPIDFLTVLSKSRITSIAFSNEDKKLAVGDFDGYITIFGFIWENKLIM